MVTQDIEKKVLERLSLADEVSKFGTIVDNPGDAEWPFKAVCSIPHRKLEDGKTVKWFENLTVLLSKSQKTYLVDDGENMSAGDVLEFMDHIYSRKPRWEDWNTFGNRGKFARMVAIKLHLNVWED